MTVPEKRRLKQVCPVLKLYCIIVMRFFQDVGKSVVVIIRFLLI